MLCNTFRQHCAVSFKCVKTLIKPKWFGGISSFVVVFIVDCKPNFEIFYETGRTRVALKYAELLSTYTINHWNLVICKYTILFLILMVKCCRNNLVNNFLFYQIGRSDVLAWLRNPYITHLSHQSVMSSLRERLRTHKVFTKDQCFYLNYHKFSIKSYVLDVYLESPP